MPWIPIKYTSVDCAVCGQPAHYAHTTERIDPYWTQETGTPTIRIWGEPRCPEHAHRLIGKGNCRHGERIPYQATITLPSLQTHTAAEPLSDRMRVTWQNAQITSNIVDTRKPQH